MRPGRGFPRDLVSPPQDRALSSGDFLMVAVVRHGRSYEDSVVESDLKRWGFWLGIQYAADGYPPSSTIEHIFSGRGDNPGHRVLCIDPPERFWDINRRVLFLRREFYEALVARYALPCKPTGIPYYPSELAGLLRVKPHTYVDRLASGRRGYRRLVFQENLVLSEAVC